MANKRKTGPTSKQTRVKTRLFDPSKFDAAMAEAEPKEAAPKIDLFLWQAFVAASTKTNGGIINFLRNPQIADGDKPYMLRYHGGDKVVLVADVLREIATRAGFNDDEREALRFAAHVVDHSVNEVDNGE